MSDAEHPTEVIPPAPPPSGGSSASRNWWIAGAIAGAVALLLVAATGLAFGVWMGRHHDDGGMMPRGYAQYGPGTQGDGDRGGLGGMMGQLGIPGLGNLGLGGMGALGQGLHGSLVVPQGSGYATVAMQRGTVTAVSPSSITVKSADGYSATYRVSSATTVLSGSIGAMMGGNRGSISDVHPGSAVTLVAQGTSTPLTARVIAAS